MDEMKITSKFTTSIFSRFINHLLRKKGIGGNVKLNNMQINVYEERAYIHLDLDGYFTKEELNKILKNLGV